MQRRTWTEPTFPRPPPEFRHRSPRNSPSSTPGSSSTTPQLCSRGLRTARGPCEHAKSDRTPLAPGRTSLLETGTVELSNTTKQNERAGARPPGCFRFDKKEFARFFACLTVKPFSYGPLRHLPGGNAAVSRRVAQCYAIRCIHGVFGIFSRRILTESKHRGKGTAVDRSITRAGDFVSL